MQNLVFSSLIKNTPSLPDTLDQKWGMTIGKVAAGIEIHQVDLPSKLDLLTQTIPDGFQDNPMTYLVGYKPNGPERTQQLTFAKLVFGRDMAAAHHYSPVISFGTMLSEAGSLDQEWGDVDMSPFWLLENSIQVPVVFHDKLSKNERRNNEVPCNST
jgi:hypothetical protein